MCILFFHAKKLASPGKFRLILVSNRDESLLRPAKSAGFWDECPDVLGGRDMQPGADQGTWLAINRKSGRLATLLNLANKAPNPNALSRGHLVADFVKSTEVSSKEFGAKVAAKADLHNPFHLITFEILPDELVINYLAHFPTGGSMGPLDLSPSQEGHVAHSISNAPLPTPLNKSKEGLKLFNQIVNRLDFVNKKDELVENLISFAKTDTKFWPDDVLLQRTDLEPYLKSYSSIFVDVPEKCYGTRTHTIILVDDAGLVDYYESTLTPSETRAGDWVNNHFSFVV